MIDALNGSKYSLKLENNVNNSGKDQEENEKSYIPGAIDMDNMQGAVGGNTLPDVQPENDMQENDDKLGEKGIWFKKNIKEKTSTEVNDEGSDTSGFVNNLPSLSIWEGNASVELKSVPHGALNSKGLPENNQSTTKKPKESRKKKKNKSKKRND